MVVVESFRRKQGKLKIRIMNSVYKRKQETTFRTEKVELLRVTYNFSSLHTRREMVNIHGFDSQTHGVKFSNLFIHHKTIKSIFRISRSIVMEVDAGHARYIRRANRSTTLRFIHSIV